LERVERTLAALLDRLGEGPAGSDDHQSSKGSVLTTPEAGEAPYEETESSAAPIMVIRDLATDTGIKSALDTRPLETVLDDIISPDLALTLITMYALQARLSINISLSWVHTNISNIDAQICRVLWSMDSL
jgi:hypothetical protein